MWNQPLDQTIRMWECLGGKYVAWKLSTSVHYFCKPYLELNLCTVLEN